ncbi:hypothetical protein CU098_005461, partial [Rhizopus stolonifer]
MIIPNILIPNMLIKYFLSLNAYNERGHIFTTKNKKIAGFDLIAKLESEVLELLFEPTLIKIKW